MAALDRDREERWKRRLPERDINGRRILPPAHAEKAADDVFVYDPLQVLRGKERHEGGSEWMNRGGVALYVSRAFVV